MPLMRFLVYLCNSSSFVGFIVQFLAVCQKHEPTTMPSSCLCFLNALMGKVTSVFTSAVEDCPHVPYPSYCRGFSLI